MIEPGKFIVLYGANNLGKSTQTQLLEQGLQQRNIPVARLKYPIYDIPSGIQISNELRGGVRTMTDLQLQQLFVQNRHDFQSELMAMLSTGTWVVAEDYTGTGIAWGVTNGIPLDVLEEMNQNLLREDLGILLDGDRYVGGIEKGHRHEEGGKWAEARATHLELAKRYGWETVNANGSPETIHAAIIDTIQGKFF
mgnify:CR=1 FL=1